MSKLKNPLLSLIGRGKLGNFTYLRRRKTNIVEKTPEVPDSHSPAQLSWRTMYQKAIVLWNALTADEKQEWESLARRKHMTGMAWFISQCLKPNPGIYLPLQGGTMSGDIDMSKHRLLKLPLPTDEQEAASKKYHDDNLPAGGYTEGARVFHSLDQSIPNATHTMLSFNTEIFDTDSIHDNVTNNSRLTCKTAGKYIIGCAVRWTERNTGFRWLGVRLNGTSWIVIKQRSAEADQRHYEILVTLYSLAVSDYVELDVYQNSGGALDCDTAVPQTPMFWIQRIG